LLGSADGETLARILIADDRHSMRTALKAMMRMRSRWEICGEARDGREAVVKAEQLQPDAVVMDFRMPLSNGIQAASEIHKSMPSIPIVLYTLYKTDELEVAAKLVGVRCVVAKEDGVHNLLAAIEAQLEVKS
jgi:DNA-binding NarL/FixJ family response regulator